MSDTLKIQSVVTFNRETPVESVKLFDNALQHIPSSFQKGELEVQPATADKEIASNVNVFYLQSDEPITIKIGDTAATPLLNMRSFGYSGSSTSFFISNPDSVEKTRVYFVSANIS